MLTKFTVAIILQFKYVSIITAFSDSEAGEIPARRRMSDLMVLLGCFFFSAALGLHCCEGFSRVEESGDYSRVVVHGLLIVVASFVEHRL